MKNTWRYFAILTFGSLLFVDPIRKLSGNISPEIMLLVDLFVFLTYVFFVFWVIKSGVEFWRPKFLVPLGLWVVLVIAGVFNPLSPGALIGAVGIRGHLWFIPLLFIGYHFFKNKGELLNFSRGLVYLSLPLFFLTIPQVLGVFGLDILNPLEGGSLVHSFRPEVTRASSIFGSAQRFGMFSMFLFMLGLGTYYSFKNTLKSFHKWFLPLSVAAAFGGVLFSGSRTALLLSLAGLAGVLLFVYRDRVKESARAVFGIYSIVRAVLWFFVIAAGLALLYVLGGGEIVVFQFTAFKDTFTYRIPTFLNEMYVVFGNFFSLFGHGAGTMSQGIDYVNGQTSFLKWAGTIGGETGIKQILFEFGVVGLVLFYWFWGKIFGAFGKVWREIRGELRPLALAIALFAASVLIRFTFVHHQVFGDFVVLVPLWFFIGVFFRLPALKETKQKRSGRRKNR